jgi:fumarate hydratase class II
MGDIEVPETALWGAQTQRALENSPGSGWTFPPSFIRALARVKLAAARANITLEVIPEKEGNAIARAAKEIADGKYSDQFPLDIFQTGSGTSTNMNTNEVIANLANKSLGRKAGCHHPVHPNDHVNRGQSSNDVIPTAIHLAALQDLHVLLIPAVDRLIDVLSRKAREFHPVIKLGRTHLQDALPVRLGQEFDGYLRMLQENRKEIRRAVAALEQVTIGGTAVGTGVNTHRRFKSLVIRELARLSGLKIRSVSSHFAAQGYPSACLLTSTALRGLALALTKMANDIRLAGSGPQGGLGELSIPPVQPGSSIMPGKVNPVIIESLLQVCNQVVANDLAISCGTASGWFELNTMLPLVAHNLLFNITVLARTIDLFGNKCLRDLLPHRKHCRDQVEKSLALVTVLTPKIGHEKAAALAREARETGRTIRQLLVEKKMLDSREIDHLLDPERLT